MSKRVGADVTEVKPGSRRLHDGAWAYAEYAMVAPESW